MRSRWYGALTCLALVIAEGADAGVLHVPGDYSSVDAALQAAAPGDTVLVGPGRVGNCNAILPVLAV